MLQKLFLFFIILLVFGWIEVFSQSSPLNLSKCWEVEVDPIGKTTVGSDNDNKIILLPAINNKIYAFDSKGKIQWQTDFSDELISGILTFKNRYFYMTKDSQKTYRLHAGSLETGLQIFEKDIDSQISQNEELNLERFHFVSSKNNIVTLKYNKSYFQFDLDRNIITDGITQQESEIDLENLNNISHEISKEKITTTSIRKFNLNPNEFLVTDKSGNILLFDNKVNEKIWRFRTGAEIFTVNIIEDNLLINSADNFIYLLLKKNGKLIWKKRLEGRAGLDIDKKNNVIISTILNTGKLQFIELNKGKLINEINLGENFLIQKPYLLGDQILLTTNKKIYSFSLTKCQ